MTPIQMTQKQLQELERNQGDAVITTETRHKKNTKDRRKPGRRVTKCAVCQKMIYQSPSDGRTSGWTWNWGWTDVVPIGDMAPHHNDCYEERVKIMREGEYSI